MLQQTVMYKIQEENTQHAMKQCFDLAKHHFVEVEVKHKEIPYKPNIKTFETVLNMGMISIITCRLKETNQLIGYFVNLISEDFFTSTLQAKEVGIYVKPEYRSQGILKEMTECAEGIAIARGAIIQILGFKKDHHEELPLQLGYDRTETIYQKVLR